MQSDAIYTCRVLNRQRPRGVTVSTLDSESSDRGSNPREAFETRSKMTGDPKRPSRDLRRVCRAEGLTKALFSALSFLAECLSIQAFFPGTTCRQLGAGLWAGVVGFGSDLVDVPSLLWASLPSLRGSIRKKIELGICPSSKVHRQVSPICEKCSLTPSILVESSIVSGLVV